MNSAPSSAAPSNSSLAWLKPTRRRVVAVLALAMAIWGWTDVRLRGQLIPGQFLLHKTDFTVYTEAGAAFFDGRDPYTVTNVRSWRYLYPPLFAIAVAPLHAIGPEWQVLVWFTLSVLMAWGAYRECVRIARIVWPERDPAGVFGPIPAWIGWTAVVAALLPALNCLQRGQVGVAKIYLLLLGFRMLVENRSRTRSLLAGLVLAVPIAVKVTPLVPVGFVLVQQGFAAWSSVRRRRDLLRFGSLCGGTVAGLALCLFIVPAALVGWDANLHHLSTWWHSVANHGDNVTTDYLARDVASIRNQSFTNATLQLANWLTVVSGRNTAEAAIREVHSGRLSGWTNRPSVHAALLAARVMVGLVLLAVAQHMGRRRDRLGQAAGFGLACASTLVVARVARAHYFVLLLPAVLFVAAWLWKAGHRRLALVYAAVPALLSVAHYALTDVVGWYGLLGIGTMLWLLAACTAMLRMDGEERTESLLSEAVILRMPTRVETPRQSRAA